MVILLCGLVGMIIAGGIVAGFIFLCVFLMDQ